MDALRILSRSTNLSVKSKKSRAPILTPSGVSKPNPQLYGQDAPTASKTATETPSRKRKRGQENVKAAETISEELDFFGNGNGVNQDSSKSATKKKSKSEGEKPAPKVKHTSDVTQLPFDECKQLLRKHKIKIAQLWTPSSNATSTTKPKKKKEEKKKQEVDAQKKQKADLVVQPLTAFSQLRPRYGIPSTLAENLEDQGYSIPTEIQLGALPLLLGSPLLGDDNESSSTTEQSRTTLDVDLLSVAPTGSGKTLAFLIPVLAGILEQRRVAREAGKEVQAGPKAIIVAPTKELASQITNEGRKLSRRTGVQVTLVKKGMNIAQDAVNSEDDHDEAESEDEDESGEEDDNEAKPKQNLPPVKADILVSTPLTLLNAITSNGTTLPLESVRYMVLDEADVLLDPLFRDQTIKIWSTCTHPLLRISLWSATMGSSIEDLAISTISTRWSDIKLQNPNATRPPLLRLIVGLKDTSLPTISHKLIYCGTEQGKLMALRNLLHPRSASSTTSDKTSDTPTPTLRPPFLIFTQTIPRAIALHSELLYDIPAEAGGSTRLAVLHADLTDTARENIMLRFRRGEIWVLITTDLLSRGVDFRGLNGVVNYDFPNSSAVYVHRVGRTGRAGREGGVAVTLYAKEDVPFVRNVANVIAASERLKTKGANSVEGEGIKQWLLDALPTPSKKEKQELKRHGVASRNVNRGEGSAKMRISTKSGYERKMENRRKGAVEGSRRRKIEGTGAGRGGEGREEGEGGVREEEGFGGFDD